MPTFIECPDCAKQGVASLRMQGRPCIACERHEESEKRTDILERIALALETLASESVEQSQNLKSIALDLDALRYRKD